MFLNHTLTCFISFFVSARTLSSDRKMRGVTPSHISCVTKRAPVSNTQFITLSSTTMRAFFVVALCMINVDAQMLFEIMIDGYNEVKSKVKTLEL